MEKKRERIGPREYAGDILKAAITLTLAQGTESAIDFVAGALDLVRAEGKDRFENQVKILSDQLEIEQASKRTCPSCGLLWPKHDDNCGLWINVEALVRIRAEIEAEVTTRERRRCAERTPSKSCNCERCTGIKIDGYYQYESSDDEGEKP